MKKLRKFLLSMAMTFALGFTTMSINVMPILAEEVEETNELEGVENSEEGLEPSNESESTEQTGNNQQSEQTDESKSTEQPDVGNEDSKGNDPGAVPAMLSFDDEIPYPQTADAYFYLLRPGEEMDAGTDPNTRWYGITKLSGSVNLDPSIPYSIGTTLSVSGNVNTFPSEYPPITTKSGVSYTYDSEGTKAPGTYSIVWERIKVANGANAGINNAIVPVNAGTPTYHVDGYAILNDTNKVTITFEYIPAGESEFLPMEPTVKESPVIEKNVVVPTMETKTGYVFDGWYYDSDFTQKVNFENSEKVINSNIFYYGRYVPAEVGYTVNYYYDGVLDASQTVNDKAKFGSTIESVDLKEKDGYVLDTVENLPLIIGADENKNVIHVYYAIDKNFNGIPDKYEVTITYQVIHGTFDGKTTVTQDYVIAQFNKETRCWEPIETKLENIPVSQADEGYKDGSWLGDIPTTDTIVKESMTYTYEYVKEEVNTDNNSDSNKDSEKKETNKKKVNTSYVSNSLSNSLKLLFSSFALMILLKKR
ncbi:InlB B-repeat-containing protein [Floccifex sp.]|uniref:InlB B-repeat-containing protein n=1 Tax=Floccifex sp. TaxID=2815810 RepID=UPI003F0A1FD4